MNDYKISARIDLDQAQKDWDKLVAMANTAAPKITAALKSSGEVSKQTKSAKETTKSFADLTGQTNKLIREMDELTRARKLDNVAVAKAQREAKELTRALRKGSHEVTGYTHDMDRLTARTTKFSAVTRKAQEATAGWWKRFGAVAVGFGVAYRAINVLENGIAAYVEILREGLTAQDEFIELQAKLAMYSQLYASNAENFAEGFRLAAVNVAAFRKELPMAISSLSDLTQGVDEFVQHGYAINPMTAHAMVNFLDFTAMIAVSVGSTAKQIRQEIQSLFEGAQKPGNQMLRLLKSLIPEFDKFLDRLRGTETETAMQELFEKISGPMDNLKKMMLEMSATKAHTVWRKQLILDVEAAARLAASMEGLAEGTNIFAMVFVRHMTAMSEAAKEDLAEAFVGLAHAFDSLLDKAPEILIMLTKLTWALAWLSKQTVKHSEVLLYSSAIFIFAKSLQKLGTILILLPIARLAKLGKALQWFGKIGLPGALGGGAVLHAVDLGTEHFEARAESILLLDKALSKIKKQLATYTENDIILKGIAFNEELGKSSKEIIEGLANALTLASTEGQIFWGVIDHLGITFEGTTVLGKALKKMFGGVKEEFTSTEGPMKEYMEWLEIYKKELKDTADATATLSSVTLSFYKDMQAAAKAGDVGLVEQLQEFAIKELDVEIKAVTEDLEKFVLLFGKEPSDRLELVIAQLSAELTKLRIEQSEIVKGAPVLLATLNSLNKAFAEQVTDIKLKAAATGQDLSAELQAICTDFFVQLQAIVAASGELVNLPEIKAALKKMRKAYTTTANSIKTDFDSILKDIEGFEFEGTSFGNELADSINNAMISMYDLNEVFTEHARIQGKINELVLERERIEAQAKLDAKNYDYIQMQMSGYRQLFGTVSQLFKENSKERENLHKAEMAFAAVELAMGAKKLLMDTVATAAAIANSAKRCVAWGVEAVAAAVAGIAGQATGDPYTAFARIAAMIALMGSVLAMAGKAFGGGGGSSGGYSGGGYAATTGTILGDPTKSSESLQNSLDLMKEYHAEDYVELVGIHNEMKNLNKNITGLVSNIVRSFDSFEGEKFEYSAKGFFGKQSDEMIKAFERITDAITLPLDVAGRILNAFTSGVTDLAGKIGDWVFGGKIKIKVTGAGIALGEGTVGGVQAGEYPSVQAYYDIYEKKSGGLFGSTKRKRWTEFEDVDADVTRLFNKIYENISNLLVYLAEGFNVSAEDMAAVFAYEFEAMKIDLKGLTGAEITEKINAWMSTMSDAAVEELFSDVVGKYQEIDEGMLETAMRLLVQKEILFSALEMTNMAFDEASASAIDFSQALIAISGDFEGLIEAIGSYYESFFTDAEKHQDLLVNLTATLDQANLTLPSTRDGYRELVEGLDLTTEAGKEAYVTLMNAAAAADTYYDTIEEFAAALEDITDSIEDIKKRYEDYGKTALDLIYEQYPEWQGMTYEQWAGTDLTDWSVDMLQEWRDLGDLLETQWEEQQAALVDSLIDIADSIEAANKAELEELEKLVNAFTKASDAIIDYQESLLASTIGMLPPDVQYAQASQQLDSAIQDLYSRDKETALAAAQAIPDYVNQFLDASKAFTATPEQYMADFARAMTVLNTAGSISAEWIRKLDNQMAGLNIGRGSGGHGSQEGMEYEFGLSPIAAARWLERGFDPSVYWPSFSGTDNLPSPGSNLTWGMNMQSGGMVSGPESGFNAPITFHGTEHIVPGDQMGEVKNILGEVKEILVQVRDTNGDQNKTGKKLYSIIDRVSQGEEYLMIKAV